MNPVVIITAAALAVVFALVLAVALLLTLCAACGAAAAWAWTPVAAARYERVLKRRYDPLPPSQKLGHRHARPQPDPAGVETDAFWDAARQASAAAELPPTVPMPVLTAVTVDLSAWATHETGAMW